MASINRVTLVGRVGADVETRYMPNGDAVANIRLATSESWKDKSTGEKKEITEWHRLTFYRKLAEIASQYVQKGALLYVEGRIRTRKWTDKDGQDRYTTEIEVTEMQMLSGRQNSEGSQQSQQSQQHRGGGGNGQSQARRPEFEPDDIPFATDSINLDVAFLKATTPVRRTA